MSETAIFLIGIIVLILGFPLGNFLAKITKEELKQSQKWFNLGIFLFSLGAVISIIVNNDILLFAFLFMVIVTSRSIKQKTGRR